ncbi:hypothetical protein V757_09800 [Pelistega indica]|uniref:ATPase AAA-type core domain-containing protein n=1 Tax=Pelistega indica TaxID=1414851 RepID=V8FX93_9BURK|nr:hypothetical protein [Pelistega indica]ETD68800.1 hypothetical protein V757_09800 [Pelistega indica]
MIITRLCIDNLFSFKEAVIDLSIKRKLAHSPIPGEHLIGFPNFRFKRVCIISGSNASGKTALGKVLSAVQRLWLLKEWDMHLLRPYIHAKNNNARIEVEFVIPQGNKTRLHRLEVVLSQQALKGIKYSDIPLRPTDTVASARSRLDKGVGSHIRHTQFLEGNSLAALDQMNTYLVQPQYSLYYLLSNTDIDRPKVHKEPIDGQLKLLTSIITSFDSSIDGISELKKNDELLGYQVRFNNGDSVLVDMEGDVTDKERLSKGTYEGIQVAFIILRIMSDKQHCIHLEDYACTYYMDEKMAYVHTELEQAILNLIIEYLPDQSQFFYTTHNYDVLGMNLPVHSYLLMNKENGYTKIIQPEETLQKNDRKLLNYIKNDVFCSTPNTDKIWGLM